jgi:hypothetical protein
MTKQDIIKLAREAGLWPAVTDTFPKELERFAALVADRDTALLRQAMEALEIGYDSAKAEADQFHAAMAGYKPHRHVQMDADVQKIAQAITALRERLEGKA